MRDPKRIEKVLDGIREVWTANPDLRFFQLVEMLKWRIKSEPDFDAFHLEDEELIAKAFGTEIKD